MALVVSLPEKYAGKFVARIKDKIIAIGDSLEDVMRKVREAGYDPREVIIDYIPDEEIILII